VTSVVFATNALDTIARGYWDQGWLEHLFARTLWRTHRPLEFTIHEGFAAVPEDVDGAVVVIPGRWHAEDKHVDWVNKEIARFSWVFLIVTGDEEDTFPVEAIKHPRIRKWTQTPDPKKNRGERSPIGDFWPPSCPMRLKQIGPQEKDLSWFFAGQINTESREQLARVLGKLHRRDSASRLITTKIFGSGLEYGDYLSFMARARVVPCPGGPFTPDTFRLFEALEAGCIPVVEQSDYWKRLFGFEPFPVVDNWGEFSERLRSLLARWPSNANQLSAWWQKEKRNLSYRFRDELCDLAQIRTESQPLADSIAVLIPTSPMPSHPDTSVIEETVQSVLDQEDLKGCEIFVMLDGPAPELSHRAEAYEEYRHRVLWLCEHRWPNTLPLYFANHEHQSGMTRHTLGRVQTPHTLFIEHDTPLIGEIPWAGLVAALETGEAELIRLHHEASIHTEHKYLMLDRHPRELAGVPLTRTVQWSQRPHLATSAFYRRICNEFTGQKSRTMIEDVMYGIVHTHWREYGFAGWDRFRLWMYTPEGNIKRSGHLDARGDDPKPANVFAYDRGVPIGAPGPT
jgi:hypothetical protein